MNDKRNLIHSDPFSARLQVSEALWTISKDGTCAYDLKGISAELDGLSITFSNTAAAKAYSALADLLRIMDALVRWRGAVLDAEVDADRFLRSAQERFDLWARDYRDTAATRPLFAATAGISTISAVGQVCDIARALVGVPLPVGVFERPVRPAWAADRGPEKDSEEKQVELTVAFLKFHIDGIAAADVHQVTPCQVHDLEVEVRVSRWPEDKHELHLTPVSVESKLTYDFPTFSFAKPSGDPPFTMQQTGRALLLMAQGLHARPFEFKYTAEFLPERGDQPVAIVGHRTLIVDGADPVRDPLCGYPSLDQQLLRMRNLLRRRSGVPQQETVDALRLLTPLCNLAGRAVQDNEFKGQWNEDVFQQHVRAELRRSPLVSVDLDEHANAAGGITDLSLRGLPIELKVRDVIVTSVDDCAKFVPQTASYAVAKSKRTAVLCVLDASPKKTAPVSPETLLDIRVHAETGVAVCMLVIQGNLARPSALSR